MNEAIREQLSAYVDGELPENEAELLIRRMSQDSELRAQVGEFLALGRIMRDNMGLAAADRLNAQVQARLDESSASDAMDEDSGPASRSLKLLGGAAIAATVALVAIFSLQSNNSVQDGSVDAPTVANSTVPMETSQQEVQRIYLINHADASSELGANGINSRFVTLELDEEVDASAEDEAKSDEESADQP